MSGRVKSPLKWHGGKFHLAERIVELMPPHLHYVEPYAGGLNVMLAKSPDGVSEIANDAFRLLTNFWRVLANPAAFESFAVRIALVPFSQEFFDDAIDTLKDPCERGERQPCVECAMNFFVACRQSLAGRMEDFASISRTRTRGQMNEQVSAYLAAVDSLPAVANRLRRVMILNRPALDVIASEDGPDTLFYLDPPYLHETRVTTSAYVHEMTHRDHSALIARVRELRGKVMLSGYHSTLYDEALADWRRVEFDMPNNAAGGSEKRRMTECVWMNF